MATRQTLSGNIEFASVADAKITKPKGLPAPISISWRDYDEVIVFFGENPRSFTYEASTSLLVDDLRVIQLNSGGYLVAVNRVENSILESAAAVTLDSTHYTVVITGTGVTQALPTPSAATFGRIYNVKNGSSGDLISTGNIDGLAGRVLVVPSLQSRTFHGTATTWWIV
jgi:hypothetical protein